MSKRTAAPACPEWCTNHNQGQTDLPPEDRAHWGVLDVSILESFGSCEPEATLVQYEDRDRASVMLTLGFDFDEITSCQLRSLAAGLVEVARRVDKITAPRRTWDEARRGQLLGYGRLSGHSRVHLAGVYDEGPGAMRLEPLCGRIRGVTTGLLEDDTLCTRGDAMKHAAVRGESAVDAMAQLNNPWWCPVCVRRAPGAAVGRADAVGGPLPAREFVS